jgi:hypothetical protein
MIIKGDGFLGAGLGISSKKGEGKRRRRWGLI